MSASSVGGSNSINASSGRHDGWLLALSLVLLLLATLWLGHTAPSAVLNWEENSAIDLIHRHEQVHNLFAGNPVYRAENAVYPPAAYVTLWPFMGWLSVEATRWLWLGLSAASLAGLSIIMMRCSHAHNRVEQWFLALIPLSMHATGDVFRYGQVSLVVILALASALLLLQRPADWWRDIAIALLMLVALIKPTISAPFFWLIVFLPKSQGRNRLRPALLTAGVYALIHGVASWLQRANPIELTMVWMERALAGAEYGSDGAGGINQQGILRQLDITALDMPLALIMLGGLGFWVAWRRTDMWVLIGITAIVARLWTYHAVYDNLLILFPIVALYRIWKTEETSLGRIALTLFGLGLLTVVAPGYVVLPPSVQILYGVAQLIIWLSMLLFFVALSSPWFGDTAHRSALTAEPVVR